MRIPWHIIAAGCLVISSANAVEIVIKTEAEKQKEEEKKEEKKEIDLPKRGQFNVNVFNLSLKRDFIVTAKINALGEKNTGLIIQNLIPKDTSLTVATLYTVKPDSKFEFAEAQVISIFEGFTQALNCDVRYPKIKVEVPAPPGKKKEEAKEQPKPDENEKKTDTQKEDKPKSSDQAPKEAQEIPINEGKKSLDFYLYVPEGQTAPLCVIEFDSV